MSLPEDLDGTCDKAASQWPDNWFENFGSGRFYYLSGLREYITDGFGPKSPTLVAEWLSEFRDEIYFETEQDGLRSLVSRRWLADIYSVSEADIDHKSCLVKDDFHNLTPTNIREAYAGKPITFSAALLVYVAAVLFARKQGDDCRQANSRFQIRFAGYFISHFSSIYRGMSDIQRIELSEYSEQVLPGNNRVFHQMAEGQPVTYMLACRTREFIELMLEKQNGTAPKLRIMHYEKLVDMPELPMPDGTNGRRPAEERIYIKFGP